MSKTEQIRAALHAVLVAADAGITRNVPLGQMEGGYFRTLRDGPAPELTEEFFNTPIYEFTMTPFLVIVVEKGASPDTLDAILAAKLAVFVAALEAVTDLGGLITALRVQPPSEGTRELFGTEDKKGAELEIEIDFWSEHSSG